MLTKVDGGFRTTFWYSSATALPWSVAHELCILPDRDNIWKASVGTGVWLRKHKQIEGGARIFSENEVSDMVLIPSREFLMGAVNDDDMGYTGAFLDEKPQHIVNLEEYKIDIHLVSVEQYHRFMRAADYRPATWQDNWLHAPLQPVRSISLPDVLKYCNWARKRLPTEAEWEKAARGGLDDDLFPWGDDAFDGSQAADRTREEGPPDIGMFPPNGFGLYDMVGSLWQWCRDDRRLYTEDRRHCPVGPLGGETRSARGGDWYTSPFHKRCSRRGSVRVRGGSGNLGFRCVRDVFKD